MKKIIITAVVAGTMLLCACTPSENAPTGSPSPVASTSPAATASDNPTPTSSDTSPNGISTPSVTTASPGNEPDIEKTKADMENMLPILDSLVRAMGIAGDTDYLPDDPEFFWYTLYLMGNNWGPTHPLVEPGDDGVTTVPTGVMEQFAGAAFASFEEFPAIPEDLQNSISFDEENDAYTLSPSDMGGTQTKLDDISVAEDGGVTAIVGLYDGTDNPEDLIGSVSFTLVKHPNAEGVSNSIYLYSVTGATKVPKE